MRKVWLFRMTGLKLLKKDILLGTLRKWYLYIIVVAAAYFASRELFNAIQSGLDGGYLFDNGTFLDACLFSTKGMEVFRFDPQKLFQIPIYWFAFQIGIHYIVAYYPEKDYKEYGSILFLAGKSRSKWWFSKCIWCLITVLLYYVVLIGTIAVVTGLNYGTMSLDFTEELMSFFFGSNMRYVSANDMLYIAGIVPFLMTAALCMLQMLLSFWLSPVVSFASMCGLYVLSAYYTAWWLPGSYTMWLRSSYVSVDGISPDNGVVISLFIMTFSILVGWVYFDRKDVI